MNYDNRHVLIIGASSGIGLELAKYYASQNALLTILCRNQQSYNFTKQKLLAEYPLATIQTIACNLERQNDIIRASIELNKLLPAIDLCIFSAACIMPSYQTTEDGIEKQLAVNHLSSFIFSHRLLPLFIKSNECRLVFISSRVYNLASVETKMILGKRSFYHPTLAYAETKLLNLIFTNQFAQKIKGEKIQVLNVHPGTVKTDIGNKHATFLQAMMWNVMKFFARSSADAANDIIELLKRSDTINFTSCIWLKGEPHALESKLTDELNVDRVMKLSYKLSKCVPFT